MKNLSLDFVQRVQLVNVLSVQEGPLGKTAPFLRVLNDVRFSEEESKQIKDVPLERGGEIVGFQRIPPSDAPEFGKKKVKVEDEDAKHLKGLLESWPKFTVADHTWADPLLKQL